VPVQIIIEGDTADQTFAEIRNFYEAMHPEQVVDPRQMTLDISPDTPPPATKEVLTPKGFEDILAKPVKDVIGMLDGIPSRETLESLHKAETVGKGRKTLLDAIADKLADLKQPAEQEQPSGDMPKIPDALKRKKDEPTPAADKTFKIVSENAGLEVSYDDPAEAARALAKLVENCTGIEQLDKLESENGLVVGEFPAEIRDTVGELINAKYDEFGAQGDVDSVDREAEDSEPKADGELTVEVMAAALNAFVGRTSLKQGKDLLAQFGVNKFSELGEDKWPELYAALTGEEKTEASSLL
jgi:hypothetical protein